MKIATAFLLMASGAALAGKADHSLPDVVVKTELGDFVFREIRVTQGARGVWTEPGGLARVIHISGVIQNRTGHAWKYVIFKPRVEDARGTQINWHVGAFLFPTFARDSSERFDYTLTGRLDAATVAMPEVAFFSGAVRAIYKASLTSPKSTEGLSFDDEYVSVTLSLEEAHIGFTLKNKMPDPVKIDWNQCSYVDPSGKSLPIIRSGTRLIDRNAPSAPTVVPPGASFDDIVLPAEYVRYEASPITGTSTWVHTPMFPNFPAAAKMRGATVSLFMPLEANGATRNYMFTVKINDVVPE